MRALSSYALALIACAAVPAAKADIYAYTDASGVTHFSNVPADDHYALLLKEPAELCAAGCSPAATATVDWRARAATYGPLINHAARISALQPALLRAVIAVESAFNPRAVSRAGAQGLMQLHPKTARRYGVGDAFDPEQNVRAGARYLSDLLRRYDNNLELALAAYNAGEEAVDRYGRQIPPYRETREYVPAVLRLYHRFLAQTS
jgi:soluble lytic murein transglycosylase-like protein